MPAASPAGLPAGDTFRDSPAPGKIASPLAPEPGPGDQERKPALHTVAGPIVFACPKGHAVEVRGEDSLVLTLWVDPACPKKRDIADRIKGLHAGTPVILAYVTGARPGQGFLREIALEPTK